MDKQEKKVTSFPKGFFTSIKPCQTTCSKNPQERDKPFEWSPNVINGKSQVKLVPLNKDKSIKL